MKGERRHELERNELADWLAKWIERIQPYQNAILGAVLLVAVASVGYAWWARQSAGKQVAGWDAFHHALWELSQGNSNPTDFEAIADDYPDTKVALWAHVMAADLHLTIGCDARFRDKAIANEELREAVDHYLEVLGSKRSSSALRQRATFGLARARESQFDLQKAMELYEEVSRNWPDGAYAAAATRRLEDLKRPDTKLLYDQFAQFDPKPVPFQEPGVPDQRPPFDLDSLPDEGPLYEPSLPDLQEKGAEGGQPKDSSPTPTKSADTQPDGTHTQPADKTSTGMESSGTKPTNTGPTDTGATDTGPANTGATDTGPPDQGKAKPADPAEPLPEKSE